MKTIVYSVVLFLISHSIHAQIITTVAGNGVFGYSGDGGLAIHAQISRVNTTSFDTANILYFPDVDNHVIRKIDSTGTITTIAGTGTAGYNGDAIAASTAQLNYPSDIVFDRNNNMYIADLANSRIRKITPSGTITTYVGNGTYGTTGDGGLASTAEILHPYSLAIDTAGNIYIADEGTTLRKVSPAGIITKVAGTGVAGFSGDGGLALSAQFTNITGVACDKKGNIYIADNYRVRKIDIFGIITTIAGTGSSAYSGDGGLATFAGMYTIRINVDDIGNLYVCDNANNRLRRVDTAGIITTYAGTGIAGYNGDTLTASYAQLNYPQGIRFDKFGSMFISEWGNMRIRKITICNSTIISSPKDVINSIGTAAHFNIVDTGVVSYQWQENAGLGFVNLNNIGIYSGTNTNTLTISSTTLSMNNYQYRCIAFNGACLDTSSAATLSVWKLGLNILNKENAVTITPNPAKNDISITASYQIQNIKIINILGQVLINQQCNNEHETVNITDLNKGIYIIKINNRYLQKIVKE